MTSARERYAELLSLTRLFLMQEHSLTDRILSEKDSYEYFRNFAAQRQEAARKAPPVQQTKMPKSTQKETPQPQVVHPSPPRPPEIIENATPTPAVTTPKAVKNETAVLKEESPQPEPKIAKEEPVKSETQNASSHTFHFALTPQSPPSSAPLDDLKKIVAEHLPHLKLIDTLPDDRIAKEISNSWEKEKSVPQVAILSFNEPPNHQLFLSHLSNAIEMLGFSTAVISAAKLDRNKGWESFLSSPNLKLVIGSGNGITGISILEKHHKENTKNGSHQLGNHPLFVLSDISFYLKEPALKQSLWKSLKDQLAKVAIPHE